MKKKVKVKINSIQLVKTASNPAKALKIPNVHDRLKKILHLNQWVVCTTNENEPVAVDATISAPIDIHDTTNWMSWQDAKIKAGNRAEAGVVLTPELGIAVIHIQQYWHHPKKLPPDLRAVLDNLRAYAEYDPNGSLQIFLTSKRSDSYWHKLGEPNITLRNQGGVVPITGNTVTNYSRPLGRVARAFEANRGYFGNISNWTDIRKQKGIQLKSDIDVLIEIMMSKDSELFRALEDLDPENRILRKYLRDDGELDYPRMFKEQLKIIAVHANGNRAQIKRIVSKYLLFNHIFVEKFDKDTDAEIEIAIDEAINDCVIGMNASNSSFNFGSEDHGEQNRSLIEGYLDLESVGLIVAPSGLGKSFLALSMALSVATGTSWYGHSANKGGVFCVLGEGRQGYPLRMKAWGEYNKEDTRNIRIATSNTPYSLVDRQDFDSLSVELQEFMKNNGRINLIIFDTLSANLNQSNDSSSPDMAHFITKCREISDMTGACTLVVHHTGHADPRRPRGSTALTAGVDTILLLNKRRSVLTLEVTKQREHELGPIRSYEIQKVLICI